MENRSKDNKLDIKDTFLRFAREKEVQIVRLRKSLAEIQKSKLHNTSIASRNQTQKTTLRSLQSDLKAYLALGKRTKT